MSDRLNQLKRELLDKHKLWNLASPEQGERAREVLTEGMRDIPIRQMLDSLQYIENQLLPAVAKKKGREEDYQFFEKVARSLAYSIIILDRYEFLYSRYINSRIDFALAKEHLEVVEKELQKYTTLEDLYMSDSLDRYAKSVAERIRRDILRAKK